MDDLEGTGLDDFERNRLSSIEVILTRIETGQESIGFVWNQEILASKSLLQL